MGYDNDIGAMMKALMMENNSLLRAEIEAGSKMMKLELNSALKGLRQDMANDNHEQQRQMRALTKEELEANNSKIAMLISDNNKKMFDYLDMNNRRIFDFIERNNRAISQLIDSAITSSSERANYMLGELKNETDKQRHEISMLKRRD